MILLERKKKLLWKEGENDGNILWRLMEGFKRKGYLKDRISEADQYQYGNAGKNV